MNLCDIPFINAGKARTLQEVFRVGSKLPNLTGSPAETILIMKFLSAVVMAALRPKTKQDLLGLDNTKIAAATSLYLKEHRDQLEIDGDKPFLQYKKAIEAKAGKDCPKISEFIIGYPSANRGIVRSSDLMPYPTLAQKVLGLLFAVIMPLNGKKTEKWPWIEENAEGPKKALPTPALGARGIAHSFVLGETLLDTLRLNLVCDEELIEAGYEFGIGTPPWEKMPTETDQTARELSRSYIGRLVPMLRFCLINGIELHATYGVAPDPEIDEPSATYVTNKAGDRYCTGMSSGGNWQAIAAAMGFDVKGDQHPVCRQLQWCLPRAREDKAYIGIQIVGTKLTSKTGEHVISTGDEMYRFFMPAADLEEGAADKLEFMGNLQSAVYSCFMRLGLALKSVDPNGRDPFAKGNEKHMAAPTKAAVVARTGALIRDLMDDFRELLAARDKEEIEGLMQSMTWKARMAIHQQIFACGGRCEAMAGAIELNPFGLAPYAPSKQDKQNSSEETESEN